MLVTGVVVDFDERRGDGWLDDGDQRWYFHCVGIADGSRRIENGTVAVGVRIVGHLGRDEVTNVRAGA